MMEYQNFLNRLQKKGSKPHRINHCLGTRDAWKWVRRNKWEALGGNPCSSQIYSQVINKVNKLLIGKILEGHEIELPYQMGSIALCNIPSKVFYKGNKLSNNYSMDWKKTLRLWYEDEEAMNKKVVVKRVQKDIYYIRYLKKKANYPNKRFYCFRINRSLSKALGNAVEKGMVIAMPIDN